MLAHPIHHRGGCQHDRLPRLNLRGKPIHDLDRGHTLHHLQQGIATTGIKNIVIIRVQQRETEIRGHRLDQGLSGRGRRQHHPIQGGVVVETRRRQVCHLEAATTTPVQHFLRTPGLRGRLQCLHPSIFLGLGIVLDQLVEHAREFRGVLRRDTIRQPVLRRVDALSPRPRNSAWVLVIDDLLQARARERGERRLQ